MERSATNNSKTSREKMRPWVWYTPSSTKGKIIFWLAIISILLGIWPLILLVNKPFIVLGMPLIMLWSIVIMFVVVGILALAKHWEVY